MRRQMLVGAPIVTLVVSAVASLGLATTPTAAVVTPRMTMLSGGLAPIPFGARVIGHAPPGAKLSIEVALAPRDETALSAEVKAVSTPDSAQYRHFLAPGEFAKLYGPRPAVISSVSAALRGEGLSVGSVTATGLAIPVSGTVAQIETAFATPMVAVHLLSGKSGYDNERAPSVPSSIASAIEGVVGLDTLDQPEPMSIGPVKALRAAGEHAVGDAAKGTITPATIQPTPSGACDGDVNGLQNEDAHVANQFAESYSLDPLYAAGAYGAGTTVALAEFGDSAYSPSDIATFASCYGISSYQLSPEGDWEGTSLGAETDESELDIETVLSMAPAASIEVYQAGTEYGNDGYYGLFNQIVGDDTAQIVSVSYGTCEDETTAQAVSSENTVLQAAALQGQTFFVSAGDSGAEACNGGGPYGALTGDEPSAQAVDAAAGTLYVANYADNTVSVIDEATMEPVATVTTGLVPDAIVFDSATSEVLVANYTSSTLTEFSTTTCQASNVSGCATPTTVTPANVNSPTGLAIDGSTLYIANANATVTVDSLQGAFVWLVQLPLNADPAAIVVDSSHEVYVGDTENETVDYFGDCDVSRQSGCGAVNIINVNSEPVSMVASQSYGSIYVALDGPNGGVDIISTSSHRVTGTIPTYLDDLKAHAPIGAVALSPSGNQVLATSDVGGSLDVMLTIDLGTKTVVAVVDLESGGGVLGPVVIDPTLGYVWVTDVSAGYDLVENLNLGVDDPASQPDVTGVGGTSFVGGNSTWNDIEGAGGGGVSQDFPMPTYQDTLGVVAASSARPCGATSGLCREVPDVSADADPATGEVVYASDQGGWTSFGGTSLASPLWAAVLAVISSRDANLEGYGLLNPTLYSLARLSPGTYFNNVSSGNNDLYATSGKYQAGSAYNMATGLGTPDAYSLAIALEDGHALTNVNFAPSTRHAGALSVWTMSATTGADGSLVASQGTIKVVAPWGTVFPGSLSDYRVNGVPAASVVGQSDDSVTIVTPVAIADATTFRVSVSGVDNPASGNYIRTSFMMATGADIKSASPSAGLNFGSGVTNVTFAPSNQLASSNSTWTIGATTSAFGALQSGVDSITLTAPTGTELPTKASSYSLNGEPVAAGRVTGQGDNVVSITTPVNVDAASPVVVVVTGVANPSGKFSNSAFSLSTVADAPGSPCPSCQLVFGASSTSLGDVVFALSTLQGTVSATWSVQATTSSFGSLGLGTGTITIDAPDGTVFPSGLEHYQIENGSASKLSVASGGSAFTLTVGVGIGDNTGFTVIISGVTNPAAASYANTSFRISTSSDAQANSPAQGITFVNTSAPAARLASARERIERVGLH